MKKFILSVLASILCLSVYSQTVGITWDASPTPNVVYDIYKDSTNIGQTNGINFDVNYSIILLDVTNSVFVVVKNAIGQESVPSNVIKINRPSAPNNLTYSAGSNSIILNWTAHNFLAVNTYFIYVGTNLNNLVKVATVNGRTTTTYNLSSTNLNLLAATNYVSISAFNNGGNSTNTFIESVKGLPIQIIKPAPATNLRVTFIIESNTNPNAGPNNRNWITELQVKDIELVNFTIDPNKIYRVVMK